MTAAVGRAVLARLEALGLVLSGEAVQALSNLTREHAFELLDAVKVKADGGHIRNPSNYVCATIARGYVPQADGGAAMATAARAGAAGLEFADLGVVAANFDAAADQLAATQGMLLAQEAGVQLTDEAVKALLRLPPEHASELLETVAEKHASLRDPSNYIAATVARGFMPRAATAVAVANGPVANGPVALPAAIPAGRVAAQAWPTSLVPEDVSPVEARVLELNALDLWQGQAISVETLLSLRCIQQEQALSLLGSLEAKGRGRAATTIQSPNNYVQAAIVKIKKGMGAEGAAAGAGRRTQPGVTPAMSWNFTGNQSRQRARELGLDLDEDALELLAKIPLKDATLVLESAASLQAQGEDPNQYILLKAPSLIGGPEAQADEARAKRPRWG